MHDLLSSSNVLLAFQSSSGVLLARGSVSDPLGEANSDYKGLGHCRKITGQAMIKKGRRWYGKQEIARASISRTRKPIGWPRLSPRRPGETLTRVVTEALRELYERVQRRRGKASIEELRAIAERAAAHVKRPYLDHAELLYDEHGLPI